MTSKTGASAANPRYGRQVMSHGPCSCSADRIQDEEAVLEFLAADQSDLDTRIIFQLRYDYIKRHTETTFLNHERDRSVETKTERLMVTNTANSYLRQTF